MRDIRCVVDWPGTASFLKDVIVAAAAIYAARVAYIGIHKWRAEESGKADFDLARRLGKVIFRFRDVIADARRPFYAAYEFPDDYRLGERDVQKEASAWSHIYNNRFAPVRETSIELQTLCNEVEALWGAEPVKEIRQLLSCAHTLHVAMGADVRNRVAGGSHFDKNKAFGDQIESQVMDTGNQLKEDGSEGDPNQFTSHIAQIVDQIAAFARTRLPS